MGAPPMRSSLFWTQGSILNRREQAPRTWGFSVWWGEGGQGPQDERLPEAGP